MKRDREGEREGRKLIKASIFYTLLDFKYVYSSLFNFCSYFLFEGFFIYLFEYYQIFEPSKP
jgi:hypothetical protein